MQPAMGVLHEVKNVPKQILLMLVMRIHHTDQEKTAWFESVLCGSGDSCIATLLTTFFIRLFYVRISDHCSANIEAKYSHFNRNPCYLEFHVKAKDSGGHANLQCFDRHKAAWFKSDKNH